MTASNIFLSSFDWFSLSSYEQVHWFRPDFHKFFDMIVHAIRAFKVKTENLIETMFIQRMNQVPATTLLSLQ